MGGGGSRAGLGPLHFISGTCDLTSSVSNDLPQWVNSATPLLQEKPRGGRSTGLYKIQ